MFQLAVGICRIDCDSRSFDLLEKRLMNDEDLDTVDVAEILHWVEFCAWSALVMTPIIWWLQGPSVSTDQFVVRTGLIVISASIAIGLRTWALIQIHRAAKSVTVDPPAGPRTDQTT